MRTRLGYKGLGVGAIVVAVGMAALAYWLGARADSVGQRHSQPEFPELFADHATCPHGGEAPDNAEKLEEVARLRMDRYAYDPRDGVRAVQRYEEAASCYSAAGDEAAAHHARRTAAALRKLVNTDYAAARLNLFNAVEQSRWAAAHSEIRRLLFLTEHIGRHGYVAWLNEIAGPIWAKAHEGS